MFKGKIFIKTIKILKQEQTVFQNENAEVVDMLVLMEKNFEINYVMYIELKKIFYKYITILNKHSWTM